MAEQFEHEVVHAKLKVSQGGDTRKIKEEVNLLVAHGWRLDDEKMGLQTSFTFPTFVKAVEFMNKVFEESAHQNHHAGIYNMNRLVTVHWTTYRPRGLSAKDTKMAQWCHEQGPQLGGQYDTNISNGPNA
ncbi:transcriptional coactivator/pterin dehydratase [Nemania serpens]|nr:transcriptional coactivator/pterin dehydratase [Nemania serpens]